MIAITTKYLGPTDTKGSRIVASANGHRLVVGFNHASSNAHAEAAVALVRKMGWEWGATALIEGYTDTGRVYVFDNSDRIPLA